MSGDEDDRFEFFPEKKKKAIRVPMMVGSVPMLKVGASSFIFDRERELRFQRGEETRPVPEPE